MPFVTIIPRESDETETGPRIVFGLDGLLVYVLEIWLWGISLQRMI